MTYAFPRLVCGQLSTRWPDIGLWSVLLAMSDRYEVISAHPRFIAGVSGLPQKEVDDCIERFMAMDWLRVRDGCLFITPKADVPPILRVRMSAEDWARVRSEVFERDNYTCQYCGARGVALECDHMFPFSRGGSDDPSNLVTACKPCNKSKRDKTLAEWRAAR